MISAGSRPWRMRRISAPAAGISTVRKTIHGPCSVTKAPPLGGGTCVNEAITKLAIIRKAAIQPAATSRVAKVRSRSGMPAWKVSRLLPGPVSISGSGASSVPAMDRTIIAAIIT